MVPGVACGRTPPRSRARGSTCLRTGRDQRRPGSRPDGRADAPFTVTPSAPDVSAHLIAPETWLIPNLAPAGPDAFLHVNSMLIRGQQPIVVDTGAPLPIDRMIWLGPDEYLDAGDRRLRLLVPPIFDGPTTRALYDERTSVLWAVDSFASLTLDGVHEAADVPADRYEETFRLFNSMISPWHQWLDPV